jgi:hypothetical protein
LRCEGGLPCPPNLLKPKTAPAIADSQIRNSRIHGSSQGSGASHAAPEALSHTTETNAELLANSDLLVGVMGYWPSFHDANVKKVLREFDACRALIHVFEMTDEVDSKGYCVLTKHHLVAIQMSGIAERAFTSELQD